MCLGLMVWKISNQFQEKKSCFLKVIKIYLKLTNKETKTKKKKRRLVIKNNYSMPFA